MESRRRVLGLISAIGVALLVVQGFCIYSVILLAPSISQSASLAIASTDNSTGLLACCAVALAPALPFGVVMKQLGIWFPSVIGLGLGLGIAAVLGDLILLWLIQGIIRRMLFFIRGSGLNHDAGSR